MPEETKQVTEEVTVKGTTSFGIGQLKNPTPMWASTFFRVFFYVASIITFIVSTDDNVGPKTARNITKYLALATMIVHGASKLTGVKVDEEEFKK